MKSVIGQSIIHVAVQRKHNQDNIKATEGIHIHDTSFTHWKLAKSAENHTKYKKFPEILHHRQVCELSYKSGLVFFVDMVCIGLDCASCSCFTQKTRL
jgi:hypothetical protein